MNEYITEKSPTEWKLMKVYESVHVKNDMNLQITVRQNLI